MRRSPGKLQADNGAGLTKGIIGLVNKGQFRKPDDWGSLAGMGVGAGARPGLSGNGQGRGREARRNRGRLRYGKAAL